MTIQTSSRGIESDGVDNRYVNPAPYRRYLIGGAALISVLAGFYYWDHSGGGTGARRAPPVPVTVVAARQQDMAVVKNTIGTVVANSTVAVTARVEGQLTKAYFQEGQMVKSGDLLFEIDPRPFQAALTQAEGQLQRDQASLVSAQQDARRYATLFAQNAISTQQRDQSDAAAKADAAIVLADHGAVDAARLNLEFTQIRSSVDGKTGPILLQPGNLVSVNGSATPLVTITQIRPIKISFNLPQADLPRIQARAAKGTLTAAVMLHGGGGKVLSAPVDFVSNAVSSSGTIELRANFPNLDGALVPGQLVDVTCELDDIPNAIVVPRIAVISGPDGYYVYRVNPQRVVSLVPVTMLYDDGADMAVQGELKGGDIVITDGGLRVLPGTKVTFQRRLVVKAGGKGVKAKRGAKAGAIAS